QGGDQGLRGARPGGHHRGRRSEILSAIRLFGRRRARPAIALSRRRLHGAGAEARRIACQSRNRPLRRRLRRPAGRGPFMNYDTIPSLPRLFFDQANKLGTKPFLWRKDGGAFASIRWARVAADVRALARGLIALGVKPGDRVALIAENRPEWLISDLAIMSVGAITVPAFSTNTVDDNKHILTHSGARGVIISSPAIARRALPAAMLAPELNFLIAMENLNLTQQLPLRSLTWGEAMSLGDVKLDSDIEERIGALARDETCCIIYTSGTGGVPKGVMLTHGSILCNIKGAYRLLKEVGMGNDVFLSF